ncbi:DUF4350 domain-containing protein [Flexithrix dorotheae]|uniref:DUF4350 domain-containing protein n=1 Tax=Flexithrix dorotheae TaxID=70993 RepID=UPI00037374D7|nr:DUF4350 domain-containing protein [Flexithrix dorotheae]
MNKNQRLYLIIGVVLVAIGAFFFLNYSNEKRYSWKETYKKDEVQPYGSFAAAELLKTLYPDSAFMEIKRSVSKELLMDETGLSNYIFIGANYYLSSADIDSLLRFMDEGNNVFISCKVTPSDLLDTIFSYQYCYDSYSAFDLWEDTIDYLPEELNLITDSVITTNFYHDELKREEPYKFKLKHPNKYSMYATAPYFLDSADCFTPISKLGYINDHSLNFIKIEFGKGNLYYHTQPVFFTNYFLREKEGLEYFEKSVSHLTKGKLYWDEASKIPLQYDDFNKARSPLSFILSQKSLRWTWYLLIVLVVIYLLVFSKRKQKIIPYVPAPANSSISYAETIGRLYLGPGGHRKIIALKMKMFLDHLRTRYNIHLHEYNEEEIKLISRKSGIGQNEVQYIFDKFDESKKIEKVTDEYLIKFYKAIEDFYKNWK